MNGDRGGLDGEPDGGAEIEREILAGEAIPTSRRERRYALVAAAGAIVLNGR